MSDKGKVILTLTMCFLAAIAIVVTPVVWSRHYTIRGILLGFAAGVGCTLVAYHISDWIGKRRRTELPPPKH